MTGGREPEALARALEAVGAAAAQARRQFIRRRALAYERERHLPGLIAIPRNVNARAEPERTRAIIALLKRALRASLARRARREWSWSPRRHEALLVALGGEMRR